jgi:hypothetical protein
MLYTQLDLDQQAAYNVLTFNMVWVQCGHCLRHWWHDTGVGRVRRPEHLFVVAG